MCVCFHCSLEKSGDVQYFQFDSTGNMYVFEPGAGFSGRSVKIEPGFELEETQNIEFSEVNVTASCEIKNAEHVVSTVQNENPSSVQVVQVKPKR